MACWDGSVIPRGGAADMEEPPQEDERLPPDAMEEETHDKRSPLQQLQQLLEGVLDKMAETSRTGEEGSRDDPCASFQEELLNARKLIADLSTQQRPTITTKKTDVDTQARKPNRPNKPKYRKFIPPDYNAEHFTQRFFLATFGKEEKRKVNIFDLMEDIQIHSGKEPKRIFSSSLDTYTFEVHDKMQADSMKDFKSSKGINCTIKEHPRFNNVVGIIYVNDFDIDNLEEFKAGLQKAYGVTDLEKASFIKPKNEETQAFLVTFGQQYLPYSIYIPGERHDSRVYPLLNRPMMCKICQEYAHTAKRCKAEQVICRKCAVPGHSMKDCPSENFKCHHCGGAHRAGDRMCPKEMDEKLLVDIQQREKVSFRRARQIMNNEQVMQETQLPKFVTHFDCTISVEDKRKISPWLLEKSITTHLGGKPKSIRSSNKSAFTVEVKDQLQSRKIKLLTNINEFPVTVSENLNYGTQKGLIYVYEYNMTNFDKYKQGLLNKCGVQDAAVASWITPRSKQATPILVTLRGLVLPEFLDIPGEQAKTKIFEMKPKPMLCKKCQTYGHGVKYCEREERCAKCSEEGHQMNQCAAESPKCYHCSDNHIAGARECKIRKLEEETLAIQNKERVSRMQARVILDQRNPNLGMNYARAVTSETSQRSAQRNQRPAQQNPRPAQRNQLNSQQNQRLTQQNLQKEGSSHSSNNNQTNQSNAERETSVARGVTEVVCQSSDGGGLFTTFVNLDEDSKQQEAKKRKVIDDFKKKMKQREKEKEESDDRDDRSRYEQELRSSTRTRKRSISPINRQRNQRRRTSRQRTRTPSPPRNKSHKKQQNKRWV